MAVSSSLYWTRSTFKPLFVSPVQAGFPSPAEDEVAEQLDLNELVVKNRTATFFVRVQGDSMIEANIQSGDILVVDRSQEPKHGKIVIAVINGEFTVKRLYRRGTQTKLIPANPAYPTLEIKGDTELQIWGVVTYVIHKT